MLNFFLNNDPLEQFDNTNFSLFSVVIDPINSLGTYILEIHFPFQGISVTIFSILLAFFLCILPIMLLERDSYVINMSNKTSWTITGVIYTLLFHIVTGFVVVIWFTATNTPIFDLDMTAVTTVLNHQINLSITIDETLISFFVAFFLLGGAEEEEDENFLLESKESDITGDIIAPLFLSNLGARFSQTGPLFLKVSSIFGFVLFNNIMGMLPYADTATSSLLLTFWVALATFSSIIFMIIKRNGVRYFFSLFLPAGAPLPLILLLVPIELVSYSFRVVSLAVRLFANMMAGHTLFKVLVGFSWNMILIGDFLLFVNLFPLLILFILSFLEFAIAIVQAYIFTVLTCMYMKDIYITH